jgi:hypothetical protein
LIKGGHGQLVRGGIIQSLDELAIVYQSLPWGPTCECEVLGPRDKGWEVSQPSAPLLHP